MASHESSYTPGNAVEKWIDDRLPIIRFSKEHLMDYPTPKNLNYWWTFGAVLAIMLVVQIVTGIVLAMHYTPHVDLAFNSVEHIRRDVNGGRIIQAVHSVGASMFFAAVYVHMFRGLYFGSYKAPREILWILGVLIFALMMATAFMGYVLPWGQMSFWAATVITNILGAVPVVGEPILQLLRGGFAVDNATLNRFFSLHYLLPFVIAAVVGLRPDNYVMANSQVTPTHIVPEWYFLPFYAILRAIDFNILFIDSKLGGVIFFAGSILILFFLPWLDTSKVRSGNFRPIFKWFYWLFVINFVALAYLGAAPAEGVYVLISKICTAYYFAYFLIILPLLGRFETPKPLPASISESVLGKAH